MDENFEECKMQKIFLALIFLCVVNVSYVLASEEKTGKNNIMQEESLPSAADLYKISKDDMVEGKSDAKVTIIEYASMTCSHCADFHKNTYPEIKKKYIDTGKVRLVKRPFPLNEPALRGSMLAICSGKESFQKFTDVLFTTQSTWAFSKNYMEVLANIAKLGGMTGQEFDACMADSKLEEKIMQDKFYAAKVLEVRATPSFFINGSAYKGSHGFESFVKVIDEILAEERGDSAVKDNKKSEQ